jgi:hypothetical protein
VDAHLVIASGRSHHPTPTFSSPCRPMGIAYKRRCAQITRPLRCTRSLRRGMGCIRVLRHNWLGSACRAMMHKTLTRQRSTTGKKTCYTIIFFSPTLPAGSGISNGWPLQRHNVSKASSRRTQKPGFLCTTCLLTVYILRASPVDAMKSHPRTGVASKPVQRSTG